ncbi:4-oxalocrotonate tautomerase family protein [Rhodococcus sp. NPDC057014]|uniref:tautomerase family protein n=1 Tax=Rhodococcus sp. NPDC057014 TaxID=3346000 RepID=UPI00363BA903
MPLVEVTITEGRDTKIVRELIHRLHRAVVDSVGANPQSVRIIVREVPRAMWAAGDQTLEERDAATAAANAPHDYSTNEGRH